MKAHLILEADGSMTILAPYNADFLKALKDAIPYDYRPYDDDSKTWRIRQLYLLAARALVNKHYSLVRVVDERAQQRPTAGSTFSGNYTSSTYSGPIPPGSGPFGSYGSFEDYFRSKQDAAMNNYLDELFGMPQPKPASRGLCDSPSHHASVDACVASLRKMYPDRSKLHILPGAPQDVVAAAYRALSRKAHPDTGGTHEAMQELNKAYASLKS